ncbi:hypothetical protein AMTR_s00144p00090470 [Amborella trichopoda]|uniref:Uncharacterized protein n=1 Tax=Amborella trichopoda TaxID=13333 RepID=W1P7X8_AMBTC|nr:hypothetical protein AMTR_s00144p00090470 [Amborella trichopoda]
MVTEKLNADYPLLELALETCFPLKSSYDGWAREAKLFGLTLNILSQKNQTFSDEWINIFIWFLGNSESCYSLWEKLFEGHIHESTFIVQRILERLEEENFCEAVSLERLEGIMEFRRIKNKEFLERTKSSGFEASILAVEEPC